MSKDINKPINDKIAAAVQSSNPLSITYLGHEFQPK